jgi:hypothetical protein
VEQIEAEITGDVSHLTRFRKRNNAVLSDSQYGDTHCSHWCSFRKKWKYGK